MTKKKRGRLEARVDMLNLPQMRFLTVMAGLTATVLFSNSNRRNDRPQTGQSQRTKTRLISSERRVIILAQLLKAERLT